MNRRILFGFTTRANEQLVKTQVEQKIVKDAQTISYWQKIVDGVHGVQKVTYYWKQIFPAHQETIIEHRYTPVVSRGIPIQDEEMRKYQLKEQKRYQQKYCMDKNSLEARIRIGATEHAMEYILTTGANWSGPIRDFRLVIDKEAGDNIVQFCMREPIKKINPTQFERACPQLPFRPRESYRILFILSPNQAKREIDDINAKIDPGMLSLLHYATLRRCRLNYESHRHHRSCRDRRECVQISRHQMID